MLAVIRYSVPDARTDEFTVHAREILDLFAAQPGHRTGHLGRAADDPSLWAVLELVK